MSNSKKPKSALDRFLVRLQNGKPITTDQIVEKFNVSNPRDLVYNLRQEGWNIVTNRKIQKNGKVVHSYQMVA